MGQMELAMERIPALGMEPPAPPPHPLLALAQAKQLQVAAAP